MKFIFTIGLLLSFSLFFGKSLWDNGQNIYKLNSKVGDIVYVKFSEKTILKYKIEQKQNNYQITKGKKGSGNIFSFFPDAEVNENDTIRNQNNLSVNNENNFTIPAKITVIQENTAAIQGQNSTLINGESFKVVFTGEFPVSSLNSDNSIYSTDIYNLDFQVYQESPTNTSVFNEGDLQFDTNYTQILSNNIVSNNTTNVVITTNLSSVKIEFKGIQDSKKKSILVNYLNSIINSLFR